MDEKLKKERCDTLKNFCNDIIDQGVLTNGDALTIIEILREACKREKVALYEDALASIIEGGEED